VADYVQHKLKRAGASGQIVDRAVPAAVLERLRFREKDGAINNQCIPQVINNLLSLALNEAAENGDARVTAEMIKRL
jgi:type II secretory pathway predicted ATPase ExeA